MQDKETVDAVLALYNARLAFAAHIDDVRVNISLLVMTAAAGAVPAIVALKPGLQRISCVMLLIFGVGLTSLHMHYNRTYRLHLEFADKLLQIGFMEEKAHQTLDYAWLERKHEKVWHDETSFFQGSLDSSWFYATALAGIGVPGVLMIYLFGGGRRREQPVDGARADGSAEPKEPG